MNQPQVLDKLKELLGREPTCSKLKSGKYLADYLNLQTPLTKLVADTEEEAFEKLLTFLTQKNTSA